eukprot:4592954-Pleurochrysis_carterae.AAC.1
MLTHRSRSYSHGRTLRAHDGDARRRASEREVLPTHHPPLGIFLFRRERYGRSRDGTAEGRCGPGVPRRSGRGSIGPTRPVDLEELEEGAPGFARSALSSRYSEPIG